ncbi:N-acetylglucosamine-1-phosphate uridyltransferase / Glucosamine-1-phosphate N-acetyltransferase [hydrothermal vent metagenome]|uniref:UDP-N-acetylglucosamine diphosphorylase n=1 Tax=hydrothermal vent metagenome TaxID=652676 RepID=A0A3B1CNG6_9ZZZZ
MSINKNLAIVIMAAGKGTRMKSDLPKVLAPLCGKPMLEYALSSARALDPKKIIVVVGHGRDMVKEQFSDHDISFATQEPQLGTAHAVAQATGYLEGFDGDVVILSGDVPLIKPETIKRMLETHKNSNAAITVLTLKLDDAASYGRVIRQGDTITAIVEAKDATPEQLEVKEINSGIYVFKNSFLLPSLKRVDNSNAQGEYYLTDLVNMAFDEGLVVNCVLAEDAKEALGINTADDLENIERIMKTTS